jgi:HEPN domain-containing protein
MANADIVNSLLKIAKSDLRASKLLYKEKLYSQSIYFFQQSIEKSNKVLTI